MKSITAILIVSACITIAFLSGFNLMRITQPKTVYGQTTQSPLQFYQANPNAYSWTVNGTTYTNNKNPYGFEVYDCSQPQGTNIQIRLDTCIPTRKSATGGYFWSNSKIYPVDGNTCAAVQFGGDGPPYTADTRTMNGTGKADSQIDMCPGGNGTHGPSFINVTKTINYDSSFCSNGNEMVLSPREDPSNPVCKNLNVSDILANPQNYSRDQLNCLMYVDDEADLTACKNGICKTHSFRPPTLQGKSGGNLQGTTNYENVCDIFNQGNGAYNVTLKAFDISQVLYGSSSFWLTWLNYGVPTPTPTPVPTYTISGHVFNDINRNNKQDTGEPNYTGSVTINTTAGKLSVTNGSYTITNISPGKVNVSLTLPLPPGYLMSYPRNGTPPFFNAKVGSGCSVDGTTGAACVSGNITNLNFAITNSVPWFQSGSGDIRIDDGITDLLPSGQFVNTTSAQSTAPGIAFSGDADPDLGAGQISSSNQLVGDSSYPEVFSETSQLDTSYPSLLAKAQNASIMPLSLASECTLTNCTLPNNLPHGIYIANGNVTLNAVSIKGNSNYIFLINGNLTVNGAISVPASSTVLFSTTKNIIINAAVGTAVNSTASSLAGWYIAGQNFIVNSRGNCTDLRLTIAGTVVANALGGGGIFQNNRDLCGSDSVDPTVSITQRLDMILNAPQFLKQQQTISQEIAP